MKFEVSDFQDDIPDLDAASGALRTLFEDLTGFRVDGSNDHEKFETLREHVKKKVESLQTTLNQIPQKIGSYEKSLRNKEKVEKAEDVNGSSKKNRYDISQLYEDAKALIKELNEKISGVRGGNCSETVFVSVQCTRFPRRR